MVSSFKSFASDVPLADCYPRFLKITISISSSTTYSPRQWLKFSLLLWPSEESFLYQIIWTSYRHVYKHPAHYSFQCSGNTFIFLSYPSNYAIIYLLLCRKYSLILIIFYDTSHDLSSYCVGCPEFIFNSVRRDEIGDVVIINCDTNIVENPYRDVSELPADIVNYLKKHLNNSSTDLRGKFNCTPFVKWVIV